MALNKIQIEEFKTSLLSLREELTHALKGTSADVKDTEAGKGVSQHQADNGTDDFVRSVSIEVSGKEMGIIRQIDRALEKIEEGTYGVCDSTKEEIPLKRLEAVPYASMTVSAQEKLEKGLI